MTFRPISFRSSPEPVIWTKLPRGPASIRSSIDLVNLSELTIENVEELDRLAPFGQENLTPRYLACNVRLTAAQSAGKNHLACTLTDGASSVDAIMFHCDGIDSLMACGSAWWTLHSRCRSTEWRGHRTVKCMLDAIEPACPCPVAACLPNEDVDFIQRAARQRQEMGADCRCAFRTVPPPRAVGGGSHVASLRP